jgi:MFS family permease
VIEDETIGAPPARGLSRWLSGYTGGRSAYPLAVLFGLYLLDQADSNVFGVVAPEIQATFHLTTASFGLIVALNFLLLLGGSIFIGHLADRRNRVRMAIVLSVVAATGSVFTGLAPVIAIFVLARIVNGAGIIGNQPVHRSLLADYYDVGSRGAVFGLHQAADSAATIIAPLVAGTIGAIFGWRSVFVLMSVPIVLLVLLALRLREPVRGGTDDASAAVMAEEEKPLGFEQSIRTLSKARTLRRTWLGYLFIGGGFLPLTAFFPLFMHAVFGLSLFGRGVTGAITSVFAIIGFLIAGRWVRRTMPVNPGRVQIASGLAFVGVGAGVVVFALSPNVPFAVVTTSLMMLIAGFFVPSSVAIQAYVAPPRVRSMAFAFGSLFLAAGAFLAPIAGGVADRHGLRTGLIAFTPFILIGGLILISAYRFVDDDRARALDSLEAAARLRSERDQVGRSLLVCRGVDVSYGAVQVLFGVDFEVKEGEIVALLGTNGAGKSTLLKAVSGLIRPDRGLIFFDGDDVTALAPWEVAAHGIVLMPGGKSVFPLMSVGDNLRLAAWLYRREQSFIDDRLEHVLTMFPRLRERFNEMAGNLSGGESSERFTQTG